MATRTAYVVVIYARNISTGNLEGYTRFGNCSHPDLVKELNEKEVAERFPEGQYRDLIQMIHPIPRRFFEEVVASMGDLEELTDIGEIAFEDGKLELIDWPDSI
jgi:hypothetical protein